MAPTSRTIAMPAPSACWHISDGAPEEALHYYIIMVGPGLQAAADPAFLVAYQEVETGLTKTIGLEAFQAHATPCRIPEHYHPLTIQETNGSQQWMEDVQRVGAALGRPPRTLGGVDRIVQAFERLINTAHQNIVTMASVQGLISRVQMAERRCARRKP